MGSRTGPDICSRRSGTPGQPCATQPVAVTGLTGVTALAAGAYHSCALGGTGTVKCWGYNAEGQLGDGSVKTSPKPVSVIGLSRVRAIVAGGVTTCALLTARTVKCWGNRYGSTPTIVPGLSGVTAFAAGYYYLCAVLTAGTVKCWGNNAFGQLGNGTFASSATPVAVTDLRGVTAITGGEDHACALLGNGTVRCWGYDQWGQLGTRPNVTPKTNCGDGSPCHPIPVAVQGLTGVAAVAAGYKHSCALLAGANVKCWGYNGEGELGNRDHTSSYVPVQVAGT